MHDLCAIHCWSSYIPPHDTPTGRGECAGLPGSMRSKIKATDRTDQIELPKVVEVTYFVLRRRVRLQPSVAQHPALMCMSKSAYPHTRSTSPRSRRAHCSGSVAHAAGHEVCSTCPVDAYCCTMPAIQDPGAHLVLLCQGVKRRTKTQ
jgi:hypothetical protein